MRDKIASGIGLLRFLYVQRVKGFDPPGEPHLGPEVVEWLRNELAKSRSYLEFGSGGSTLLANKLGVPTIVVESDRFYAAAVRRALQRPELVEFITPPMGLTREWGMPVLFRSRKGERYVMAPVDRFQSRFPDLVLVDGRYRIACTLQMAREASKAGARIQLLLDDYQGRSYGAALEPVLGSPQRVGRAAVFTLGVQSVSERAVREYLHDPR